MNKINFKEMKAKVGIDDVAYHLGYRIDKGAGLGRYIEMVNPTTEDKIIIKNPQDKALQSYFKRDGNKGGDVITFIQEHLGDLGHGGKNQWQAVVRVLADFTNTYVEESQKYLENVGIKGAQVFDPKRYDVQPVSTDLVGVSRFLEYRGLNMDTLTAFSDHIVRLKDKYNSHYDGYNIAFPYTRPSSHEVVGYEVRGYKGFKSKAAGTDSSNAAWIVDLSTDKNPLSKTHIFFTESAFDAMALYQYNKTKLDLEHAVFVSIGGTFSENQVRAIMHHYKNATAVDAFDNDLAGRLYGARMVAVLNDSKFETNKKDDLITIKIKDKERTFREKEITPYNVGKEFSLPVKVLQWKAPQRYKDWNDAVQNKSTSSLSKYQQTAHLHTQRKSMKI